jgi:hypothetical protein
MGLSVTSGVSPPESNARGMCATSKSFGPRHVEKQRRQQAAQGWDHLVCTRALKA